MAADVSNRISLLRYLLIFGVVLVHIPEVPGLEHPAVFQLIQSFLADGVSRASVPLLTCISGYLLFASAIDRRPGQLLAAKTRSLLVPMAIWNLALLVVLYVLQEGDHWTPFFRDYYPFYADRWIDGVFAIDKLPANTPTYFLRDLYVASLLAPLCGLFLRRLPFLGLALLILIMSQGWDGQLFVRGDIAVNFYIGGLLATQRHDLGKFDDYAGILLALFVCACALVAYFGLKHNFWFKLLAPWLLWPVSWRMVKSRFGPRLISLSKYSFFFFMSHYIVLRVLWRLYFEFDADGSHYAYFWFLSPVVAALIAWAAYVSLEKLTPSLLRLVLGRALSPSPRSG